LCWYDNNLVLNHNDIVFRSGQYPDMKFNQLAIAPWLSSGPLNDHRFWFDSFAIGIP